MTTELSPREQQILNLMAEGKTNPAIARELGIHEQTVKTYASIIYLKLGVPNRTAAVATTKGHQNGGM